MQTRSRMCNHDVYVGVIIMFIMLIHRSEFAIATWCWWQPLNTLLGKGWIGVGVYEGDVDMKVMFNEGDVDMKVMLI